MICFSLCKEKIDLMGTVLIKQDPVKVNYTNIKSLFEICPLEMMSFSEAYLSP